MSKIKLHFDYTVNGLVRWAAGVEHEATDELRQLLTDGVAGVETLEREAGWREPAAAQAESEPVAEPQPEGHTSEQGDATTAAAESSGNSAG